MAAFTVDSCCPRGTVRREFQSLSERGGPRGRRVILTAAMPLPKSLQDQLDDLAMFTDRSERIEALIDIGRGYVHASEAEVPRTPEARVPGCESEVYVKATPQEDGTLDLRYAVDNPQGISAMALAQILEAGLKGVPRTEIVQVPEEFVYEVFGRELSMGKSMGLMGMIRMAKAEAGRAS